MFMPMISANNQVELSDKVYLFRSQRGRVDRCLILGHGGWKASDGSFALPAGVTANFYNVHGKALLVGQANLIQGPRAGATVRMSETVTAPNQVYNYSVGKSVGKHSKAAKAERLTYLRIEDNMLTYYDQNWCPHVVTVRNRVNESKTVLLRDIIATVKAYDQNIANFNFGACRSLMREE